MVEVGSARRRGDETTRQTWSLFFDEKGNHAACLACSPSFRSCAGEMVQLACMRGVVDVASMDSLAAWEELGRG